MQYLMALVPALCWGSVGLVSGKLGGSVKQQTLGMVFGATLFAIVFTLFNINAFLASCSLMLWILGILSGFLWTVGQTFQFSAMKKLGISKAYPLSTGTQLIGNCIFGVLVFHEWKTGEQTARGLCALIRKSFARRKRGLQGGWRFGGDCAFSFYARLLRKHSGHHGKRTGCERSYASAGFGLAFGRSGVRFKKIVVQ